MRQQAHHTQVAQTPEGWGENMGFLEGAGAIWSSTPNSPLTLGSPCLPGIATGSSRERKGAVCLPQSWHQQQEAGVSPPTPQAAWH